MDESAGKNYLRDSHGEESADERSNWVHEVDNTAFTTKGVSFSVND